MSYTNETFLEDFNFRTTFKISLKSYSLKLDCQMRIVNESEFF